MSNGACFHCGEAIAADARVRASIGGSERAFCCGGCRAAAEWLHEGGLGEYYALRSAPAARVETTATYGDWDSPGFHRLFVRAVGDRAECDLVISSVRCAACAWLIDRVGRGMTGVEAIQVDPASGHARLRFDPAQASLAAVAGRLAAIGYPPQVVHDPALDARARRQSLKRLVVAGLGAMQAMMFTEALYWGAGELDVGTRDFFRLVALLVATPVVFYSGAPFFRGAWRELGLRRPGMDLLVALSVGLAYAASLVETVRGGPVVYFDAAVMFVFLLGAARHVEAIARQRASERLQLIASAEHQHAQRIEADGRLQNVALGELALGERIEVATGAALPVDGILENEVAHVDEALLSGESVPVLRRAGDTVCAGSIALDAPLRLRVSAIGSVTRLGQLRARLGAGLHRAAHGPASGERIAAVFTALMLLLAAATALYWQVHEPARALPAVLAVLAAACPCALALALPASLAAAHAMLARHGVIVTSADALARVLTIDHIVTDKTGTLTEGRPQIASVELLADRIDRASALAIAAALERGHQHPLARAFRAYDSGDAVDEARTDAGSGVVGRVRGSRWKLGRADWCGDDDRDALVLADEAGPVARFVLRDHVRAEAAAAVAAWRRHADVELLSGDHEAPVQDLAVQLQIDAHARQSPAQKRALICARQAEGRHVLMLGDGLNDAESLAAAEVGVAMGGGASLAHCHADVLLLRDDLRLLELLFQTAERARRITRQNLAWAIGYHLVLLPLAVSGAMSPWLAAVGMAASSLLVTLNALRLRTAPGAHSESAVAREACA